MEPLAIHNESFWLMAVKGQQVWREGSSGDAQNAESKPRASSAG